MSNCDVVTFPLVSCVRYGAGLYRFLIFALFLTFLIYRIVTREEIRRYWTQRGSVYLTPKPVISRGWVGWGGGGGVALRIIFDSYICVAIKRVYWLLVRGVNAIWSISIHAGDYPYKMQNTRYGLINFNDPVL